MDSISGGSDVGLEESCEGLVFLDLSFSNGGVPLLHWGFLWWRGDGGWVGGSEGFVTNEGREGAISGGDEGDDRDLVKGYGPPLSACFNFFSGELASWLDFLFLCGDGVLAASVASFSVSF